MDHKDFGGLLLACALAAPLLASADDIFLRLDGIQGDSIDARHKGEIDVLSYTQSMTGPFAPTTAGGAAGGKTTCGPVTLTKYVDVSSPDLFSAVANGQHIKSAVITFRRPGQNPIEYYKVTLGDAIITQVTQSDRSGPSERVIENVTLIGRSFDYEYNGQDPKGGSGARPKFGWDCVAGKRR